MSTIDPFSDNFKKNGLWQRLLEYVGGDTKRAEAWWDLPAPHEPFNFRTPRDLMTTEEWDKVRIFLESRTPRSTAKFDYGPMNYYSTDRDGLVWQREPREKYKIKTENNQH